MFKKIFESKQNKHKYIKYILDQILLLKFWAGEKPKRDCVLTLSKMYLFLSERIDKNAYKVCLEFGSNLCNTQFPTTFVATL